MLFRNLSIPNTEFNVVILRDLNSLDNSLSFSVSVVPFEYYLVSGQSYSLIIYLDKYFNEPINRRIQIDFVCPFNLSSLGFLPDEENSNSLFSILLSVIKGVIEKYYGTCINEIRMKKLNLGRIN